MPNFPDPTQGSSRSKVVYHWVFLFMYNIEVEYPFSCVHINDLEDSEFPFNLIDGPLDDESRKVPFLLFSGLNYCLFSKIEEGKILKNNCNFSFPLRGLCNLARKLINYWQNITSRIKCLLVYSKFMM